MPLPARSTLANRAALQDGADALGRQQSQSLFASPFARDRATSLPPLPQAYAPGPAHASAHPQCDLSSVLGSLRLRDDEPGAPSLHSSMGLPSQGEEPWR